MARAEESLWDWARSEMGLAAGGAPEGAALRRLCSGPCADIWAYVTRHVHHPRNVKKIRGNLLWYQQLNQSKAPEATPAVVGSRGGSLSRLRRHLGGLRGQLEAEQGRALALEASWRGARGGALRRRAGELRGGAAAAAGAWGRLRRLRRGLGGRLQRLQRSQRQAAEAPPLSLALAAGMEPPVLAATRSVCALRATVLRACLEPRPRTRPRREAELKAANERWVRATQALLSCHPPGRVLEALELLARESGRELLRLRPHMGVLDTESETEFKASPTVETLIQEHWVAVGGLWSHRPPLGCLRQRLQSLLRELRELLGGDPKGDDAARLLVTAAALQGFHAGLAGRVRALAPPSRGPLEGPGTAWGRAVTKQRYLLRRQRQLWALLGDAAAWPPRLPPRRQQAAAAAAALAEAPPAVSQEGQQLQRLLGALGSLGEPRGGRRDPLALPPLLEPLCNILGFCLYKAPAALLPRAAERRQELRCLRGLLGTRRREQQEQRLRPPPDGQELAASLWGQRKAEAAALLPRLRALSSQCQRRIDDWPRLLALVSQWWDPPMQRVLATPPGRTPFSHWLQRWSRVAQGPASP